MDEPNPGHHVMVFRPTMEEFKASGSTTSLCYLVCSTALLEIFNGLKFADPIQEFRKICSIYGITRGA